MIAMENRPTNTTITTNTTTITSTAATPTTATTYTAKESIDAATSTSASTNTSNHNKIVLMKNFDDNKPEAEVEISDTTTNISSSSSCSTYNNKATAAAIIDDAERRRRRFAVLSYEQVERLDAVMNQAVAIHGRGNFPTLDVKLKDLVAVVRARLEADNIKVRDIRVNGGAASHILAHRGTRHTSSYNDLDLIFGVNLSTSRNFERVKTAVLESLLEFLPEGANRKRISACSLKEAYVRKMVKVTSGDSTGDRWSLITLGNNVNNAGGGQGHGQAKGSPRSRNVELKFVDSMRRQFEFSVDSFQIVLDSLLVFYECATMPMADDFYPTVVGESVYGDFDESLQHLHEKLIATRNPEEIRGGGLLKYCHLLVRGYRAVSADHIKSLERYMCSRFFIDFSDLGQQQQKLENYLANHFGLYDEDDDGDDDMDMVVVDQDDDDQEGANDNTNVYDPFIDPFDNCSEYGGGGGSDVDDESTMITTTTTTGKGGTTMTIKKYRPGSSRRYLTYDYLMTLYRVVDESTVCLMGHERRQTLGLIEELACQVYFHEQQRMFQRYFERQQLRRLLPTSSSSSLSSSNYEFPQLPQYQRMAPWQHQQQQQQQHHQHCTIYGNSTIYYTPYVPPSGHNQQHHQRRHYNHNHNNHHHHQQQQHQHHHLQPHQHYTISWLPCA